MEICNTCNKRALFICGQCKIVCYCSVECQNQEWEEHSVQCLNSVQPNGNDGTALSQSNAIMANGGGGMAAAAAGVGLVVALGLVIVRRSRCR